jgi:hypothetical protein
VMAPSDRATDPRDALQVDSKSAIDMPNVNPTSPFSRAGADTALLDGAVRDGSGAALLHEASTTMESGVARKQSGRVGVLARVSAPQAMHDGSTR